MGRASSVDISPKPVIAAGHTVTFFNRGLTGDGLFIGHEHVRGDRSDAADVARLARVDADLVIDSCGYTPDEVRASALAVAPWVERYVFVSSIDALDLGIAEPDETTPMKAFPRGTVTGSKDDELYGVHKAECERGLVRVLGEERVLVVRRGSSSVLTIARIARGGGVLAPRTPWGIARDRCSKR